MAKPLPWPNQTLYAALLITNGRVNSIATIGLVEGLQADNYSLIEHLLPRLQKRTQQVITTARRLIDLYQVVGRPPKWYIVADGILLVHCNILDEIKRMQGYCNGHRWQQIEMSLEAIQEATGEIEQRIKSVPAPEPDLTEFEQVAALAMEAEE